jgi:hypothetical protein
MAKVKKKYLREKKDIIKSLVADGRRTAVLNISLLETSKIKGHLIYMVNYIDNGTEKQTHIIAKDITDAMRKLEPFLESGIPSTTTNYLLGSQTFNKNNDE